MGAEQESENKVLLSEGRETRKGGNGRSNYILTGGEGCSASR